MDSEVEVRGLLEQGATRQSLGAGSHFRSMNDEVKHVNYTRKRPSLPAQSTLSCTQAAANSHRQLFTAASGASHFNTIATAKPQNEANPMPAPLLEVQSLTNNFKRVSVPLAADSSLK